MGKFGCMGDPVNLASRLEGLCKVYGVGIMCSSDTIRDLPCDAGFVFRKLDLVQVKGKNKPTTIYEVIGCDNPQGVGLDVVSPQQSARAKLYEEALQAYQGAKFCEAVRLAENLAHVNPEDLATQKLLERARGYASQAGFWSFLSGVGSSPISAEDLSGWTGAVKMSEK